MPGLAAATAHRLRDYRSTPLMTGRRSMTARHRRHILRLQRGCGGQSQQYNRKQTALWHLDSSMRHALRMIQANRVFSANRQRPMIFFATSALALCDLCGQGLLRLSGSERSKAFNRVRQQIWRTPRKPRIRRNRGSNASVHISGGLSGPYFHSSPLVPFSFDRQTGTLFLSRLRGRAVRRAFRDSLSPERFCF
jgi:hypothetical protein